jgi:hypothetical protein
LRSFATPSATGTARAAMAANLFRDRARDAVSRAHE